MSGADRFLPGAIAIVQEAIKLDKEEKYEEAMNKYMESLERFMVALKYEKNPTRKGIIEQRVAGYMKRAEALKVAMAKQAEAAKKPAAAPVGAEAGEGDKSEADAEDKKLQGKLNDIILTKKPNVQWDDVAGLELAKRSLKETVILPVRFPNLFSGKRRPFGGILLYGPPGTGKSYLATAVATEADATFMSVSSANLVSKWQGESERLVKTMFKMARDKIPTIIFVDEVDSLCSARGDGEAESSRRIKTEFLIQMQGVGKSKSGLLVLGATNIPWDIDAAMRRRFEKRVYIPLPKSYARSYMFQLNLGDTPHTLGKWSAEPIDPMKPELGKTCTNPNFTQLGEKTDGYSGSDVSVLVREALMEPVRTCQRSKYFRCDKYGQWHPCNEGDAFAKKMSIYDVPKNGLAVPPVTLEDFLSVIQRCHASVAPSELKQFEKWTDEFGEEGA